MSRHTIQAVLPLVLASVLNAQRPVVMNGFQHTGAEKQIESLDWAGLYTPLPQYEDWWTETAQCAHLNTPTARVDSVQFYFVNAVDFAPVGKKSPGMVVGATYAQFEQIYIAVRRITHETIVKHEMLHQLLFWSAVKDWDSDKRPEFKRCHLELGESVYLGGLGA